MNSANPIPDPSKPLEASDHSPSRHAEKAAESARAMPASIDSLCRQLRIDCALAISGETPGGARLAADQAKRVAEELLLEAKRALLVDCLIELAQALAAAPDIEAARFAHRGTSFNMVFGRADAQTGAYRTHRIHEHPIDPLLDFKPELASPLEAAFARLHCASNGQWGDYQWGSAWIVPGSTPMTIGAALAMAWLPSWIEAGALDHCSEPGSVPKTPPRL